jgi:hypothetical protein
MHLDVINYTQPHILLLLCEIPGHHLGTKFSHPQFYSQYQMNGFPAHVQFISNYFDFIFDWIGQVLLQVLCFQLSMFFMVVCCAADLQLRFCHKKTFCASKRLVLLALHHLQRPAEVFHMLW